jgi:hypothetical protein
MLRQQSPNQQKIQAQPSWINELARRRCASFDIMMLSGDALMREDDNLDRGFAFAKGEKDCSRTTEFAPGSNRRRTADGIR